MRKRETKLQLHRETVLRLDPREVRPGDLAQVRGAAEAIDDTGRWSSCGQPDCCPETF